MGVGGKGWLEVGIDIHIVRVMKKTNKTVVWDFCSKIEEKDLFTCVIKKNQN